MSSWTHITACLSVDTGLVEPRAHVKRVVTKELKEAPKITGSEGNADVFVNVQSGHDFYMSCDCAHCEYRDTIVHTDEGQRCDAPDDYKCKEGEYQTRVVISVQGDLRDRWKDDTQKEFDEFLEFIKRRYLVRDYSVNIEGDC